MSEPDAIADAILGEFPSLTESEAAEFADQARSRIAKRIRRRGDWFAAELVRLRDEAGLTIPALAQELDCSKSKLDRIFAGDLPPAKPDLSVLLSVCGAPTELAAVLHEEAGKRRHARRFAHLRAE